IHCSRPPADKYNPWSVRQSGIRQRHESGSSLMPTSHDVNCVVICQAVQHAQIAFTRNTEYSVHTLATKCLYDDLSCPLHPSFPLLCFESTATSSARPPSDAGCS